MNRATKLFAAVAVLALVAGACRSGGPSSRGDIQTDVGVTEDGEILLGELSPFTGGAEVIGEPLTNGHRVYFQYVNEVLGGVGRNLPDDEKFRVRLVERDTQYPRSDIHRQQYTAIKDQVLAIAQSLGTPTTQAILQDINRDRLLTGAATLSAAWVREKYVVPAGAPYQIQFINAAAYIVNEQGVTPKAGIIYQDDDYGEEGIAGLRFAAEQFGFEVVAEAGYRPGDEEFTAQVTAMRNAGADHVFLTALPTQALTITGTAAAMGYATRWIGQSPTWIGAFTRVPHAEYLEQTYWLVNDGACQWGETGEGCEGMQEMLDNIERFDPDQAPDIYFQFGYTQARIFHQILERAIERGDLTRNGIVEAFESLSDVDMGGLLNPISYGPNCEDKVPATATSISAVDAEAPAGLSEVAVVDDEVAQEFPFCE